MWFCQGCEVQSNKHDWKCHIEGKFIISSYYVLHLSFTVQRQISFHRDAKLLILNLSAVPPKNKPQKWFLHFTSEFFPLEMVASGGLQRAVISLPAVLRLTDAQCAIAIKGSSLKWLPPTSASRHRGFLRLVCSFAKQCEAPSFRPALSAERSLN